MAGIPPATRNEVASKIITRAIEAGWEDLTSTERSRMYEQWVEDPDIGGVLTSYVPKARVRVWIKDGPMKEFARARRGLGPYAVHIPEGATRYEEQVLHKALGDEWRIVEDTIDAKPARFRATSETDSAMVFWGTAVEVKHLYWAALNTPLTDNPVVVVTATRRHPVTEPVRQHLGRLSARTGTETKIITLTL